MKKILTALCASIFLTAIGLAQEPVFDHDFENSTAGDLSGTGMLGTPAAGTWSATGGVISTNFPGYTTGSNTDSNAITTIPDGSFDDVGTPAGNFLTANLSSPAAVTGTLGTGQTTTVNFQLGVFGTNNETAFKYIHVRGISSTGAEVFQVVYRAGSVPSARELYARELGQDNTTFAEGAYVSNDGSLILDDIQFGFNSINTDVAPTGKVGVTITFDNSGWNATAVTTNAALDGEGNPLPAATAIETPATGLSIASGAPDLASIVFFASQNSANGMQNNGLWLDNVVVETDMTVEPSDPIAGDFNGDGVADCAVIDSYIGNLGLTAAGSLTDLDLLADGTIDSLDAAFLVENLVITSNGVTGTALGDLNCDGQVNVLGDAFILVANLNNVVTSYSQGDINLDGSVNVLGDAFALVSNLGFSNAE